MNTTALLQGYDTIFSLQLLLYLFIVAARLHPRRRTDNTPPRSRYNSRAELANTNFLNVVQASHVSIRNRYFNFCGVSPSAITDFCHTSDHSWP